MRGVFIVLGLMGVLVLTGLLYVAVALRPLPALQVYRDSQPVVVSQIGEARQDGVLVGRAETTTLGTELRIALGLPGGDQAFINGLVTLRFPNQQAKDSIVAAVLSVQGESPFSLSWETGNQLSVRLRGANVEGYPVLILQAKQGYFTLPVSQQVAERIVGASIWFWLGSSLLLLLATSVLVRLKTRPVKWQAIGERQELPGDMRPLELAMLHHSTLRPSDIAAFLFDLAERGHLQIVERDESDILFLRSKKEEGLSTYEKNFLLMVFPESEQTVSLTGVTENLNQELFSAVVSQFYVDVNDGFTNRGFFRDSPRLVHLRYKTVGIITQFAGLAGAVISYWVANQTIPGLVVLCVTIYCMGLLVYGAGATVVPLSRVGHELVRHCAQFQNYLTSKQAFLGNENGQLFYRHLPHAVVLGVAQPWMNRFIEHVQWYIPQWYTSLNGEVVRADAFVNQVELIARQLADVMVALKDPNVD